MSHLRWKEIHRPVLGRFGAYDVGRYAEVCDSDVVITEKRILSGLMSWWITPLLCMNASASLISNMKRARRFFPPSILMMPSSVVLIKIFRLVLLSSEKIIIAKGP